MELIDIKKYYEENNYLFSVIVELTTICNFNCVHCFIDKHDCYGLNTNEIKQLLYKLRKAGVYEIQFTGGEIFTRKDAFEIIEYARELRFKVCLLTNVSLLDDNGIDRLKNLCVESVSTTLFSLDDEINDKITGVKNSASIVVDKIKKLSQTNIRTEIKTVVFKNTISEYSKINMFCIENGINFLATEGVFPSKSGSLNPRKLSMTYNQLCGCIEELDKIRFGDNYCQEKNDDDKICHELQYSLFIDSKGDVFPCNMWFEKIGDFRDPVDDLWNNPFLLMAQKKTWKDLKKCKVCDNKKYCVRCSGIAYSICEDYLAHDSFSCVTAKARKMANNRKMRKGGCWHEEVC